MLGPIFVREWRTLPRWPGHYALRAAYLGLLWVLSVTAWQALVGWNRAATLGEWARFGPLLFQLLAYVQLTLTLFFSGLLAASAVAQEKERGTLDLLLLTDMRPYEIVLGKLLGSLLPVLVLWMGSVPILAALLLLGGLTALQVGQVTLIVLAAALAVGSLGGLMALWRERTFPALALTVLALVLYLGMAHVVGAVTAKTFPASTSLLIQASLDPFTALHVALDPFTATEQAALPLGGFLSTMMALTVALNGWSMYRLRTWAKKVSSGQWSVGGPRLASEPEASAPRKQPTGTHRTVWDNPILWRELRTSAYGRWPVLIKLAYLVVVILVCLAAWPEGLGEAKRSTYVAARGLVPVTILSLLLVGAQAVTALTSERDSRALDLLLVTDLTPREFIFGKLAGIAYNAKEYLVLPLVLVGVYAALGELATPRTWGRNIEAGVCLALGLLVLLAFALVLGVHVALRVSNSRQAIAHVLGTLVFLSVGTLVCVYLILMAGRFEYQWTSFLFFLVAAIGGLWWVLSGDRPAPALTLASWLCPLAIFYAVSYLLIGRPGTGQSADPLIPLLVIASSFGFTIAAMLVPMLSEFDVALGRTREANE